MNQLMNITTGTNANGPFTAPPAFGFGTQAPGGFAGYQSISAPTGALGSVDNPDALTTVILGIGNYVHGFYGVALTVMVAPVGTDQNFFDVVRVINKTSNSVSVYSIREATFALLNADGSVGGDIPTWSWCTGNSENSGAWVDFQSGGLSEADYYPTGYAAEALPLAEDDFPFDSIPTKPAPFLSGALQFVGYDSASAPVPNLGSIDTDPVAGVHLTSIGIWCSGQLTGELSLLLVTPPGTKEDFFDQIRVVPFGLCTSGNSFIFAREDATYQLSDSSGNSGGDLPTWIWSDFGFASFFNLYTLLIAFAVPVTSGGGNNGGGGGVGTTQKFSYYVRAFFTRERYVRSNVVFPPYPGESA